MQSVLTDKNSPPIVPKEGTIDSQDLPRQLGNVFLKEVENEVEKRGRKMEWGY